VIEGPKINILDSQQKSRENIYEYLKDSISKEEMRDFLVLSKENSKLIQQSIRKHHLLEAYSMWHPGPKQAFSTRSERGGDLPNWSAGFRKQNAHFQLRFTSFALLQCRFFS
jgi:hypothetical protein